MQVTKCAMAGPTANPFVKAFACAAIAFSIGISVALGLFNPRLDAFAEGELFGRLAGTVADPCRHNRVLRAPKCDSLVDRPHHRNVHRYPYPCRSVAGARHRAKCQADRNDRSNPKAKNASLDMTLTVDDYLRVLPKN